MRKWTLVTLAVLASGVAGWYLTAPPSYHEVSVARVFGDGPVELQQANVGDVLATNMVTIAKEVPGHDEVLPIPGTSKVLVSARDEWIWMVDSETGDAKKLALSPVSPTGAKMAPGNNNLAYFCMARLDNNTYEHGPGLYLLDIKDGKFSALVTRVPITGNLRDDGLEVPNFDKPDVGKVYAQPLNEKPQDELNESNSRPMQFCNDLDVSRDGKHVYMTEPFSNPKASSGTGAVGDAITLARNGRVWRYNTETRKVGLVLENSIFADGILIEYDEQGNEKSLLITETVNVMITRANMFGPKSETYETLWSDLPSLPDGLDRDQQGRVWVGLIKKRSKLADFVHKYPWLKHILLRLPPEWLLGTERETGFMVLSKDASEILAFVNHSGDMVRDLSVVVPHEGKVFLSSFYKGNAGVHYVPESVVLKK